MLKIKLNRKSGKPLYVQLQDALRQAIAAGEWKTGDKLPPVSVIARDLNITPSTVLRAFEDLSRDKYIVSFVGRGTFVSEPGAEAVTAEPLKAGGRHTRSPLQQADYEYALAARRLRMGIAGSLDALQVLVNKPGVLLFTSGTPDPELAAPGILVECTTRALQQDQRQYQVYAPAGGLPELRDAIAAAYNLKGAGITRDNVLITSGSQQAFAILAQVALEKRYRVIVESPCYMGISNAFGAIGHWVESLARDETGPIPEKFARFADGRPSLLYLCTKLHNPMGTDLSGEKTRMISAWARKQESLIISDEIFEDLYYADTVVPGYFESLGKEHTVVVSSLSKSFMCGLRIGWVIAGKERIRSFMPLKRAIDIGCPPLMQGIALALIQSGEYARHIQRGREHYRIRCESVLKALEKNMPPGVSWTKPAGGMHMWVELPSGYSSIAYFLLAIKRGVAITPGPKMDVDHRFINGFRLSFGSVSPQQINEGIELLAEAAKELLAGPPADPGLSGLGDFG